jgi:hypothetical protein
MGKDELVKLAPLKGTPHLKLPPMSLPSTEKTSPPAYSSKQDSSPEKDELYTEDFDEDIDEEIEIEDFDEQQDSVGNPITDSHGASSSIGADASVNSMTLEGYDHVEPVSRLPK